MSEITRKTGRTTRTWTEADDARLIELRREGRRIREIASDLNRSPRAVEDRVTALIRAGTGGIARYARQVFTEAHDRAMTRMFAAGASYRGIAAAIGLGADQVKGRLRVLRERGVLAEARDLATADIQGEIHARKASDAERERDARAKGEAAREARDSLRDEVVRCRKLARKHGWAPRPAKKSKAEAA